MPFPTTEDETTFLRYQIRLRESGTRVLHEAMLVLDIIDAKTKALLSYISLCFAAMIFLLTGVQGNANLRTVFFSEKTMTTILLLIITALLVAIILSLSCLNIVGAHTVRALKSVGEEKKQKEYENLIIKVTLGRRTRYLIAHRISVVTAVGLLALFILLIVSCVW